MDSARQWAKREKEDLDTLSEWIKAVRLLIQMQFKTLNGSTKTHATSICQYFPNSKKCT